MSKENKLNEFKLIIHDIMQNPTVQEMKLYRQHYETSCFAHCFNVSFISYKICKKLKLDYKSVARAAMLHDLFLYDWRYKENERKGLHAFTHPKTALENSKELFDLSTKEEDIILKHMWPVTIQLPKYPESYIVTLVDKYSAICESFKYYRKIFFSRKYFRLAYLFFSLCIISL